MRKTSVFLAGVIIFAMFSMLPVQAEVTSVTYNIPITYEANATYTLSATFPSTNVSFTLPWPLTVDDVLEVHYSSNATSSVQLTFYNESNSIIKTVQLSTGPGDTIVVPLSGVVSNLTVGITNTTALGTEVWSGTITIVVTSKISVEVYGYPTGQITMEPGKIYAFNMYVKHKTGPSGSFTVSGIFTKNGKTTYDLTAQFSPSFWSSSIGKIQNVRVTLKAGNYADGTYNGKIKIYFTSDARSPTTGRPLVDNAVVAELSFEPITIGLIGGSGALLGSIFGASVGMWAVALSALFIIFVIVLIMRR